MEKVKNNKNNNKVTTRKCVEKRKRYKTYDRHGESYEARKKEKKNEAFKYRKKGRRLNVNLK